jgi:hypothetical protein
MLAGALAVALHRDNSEQLVKAAASTLALTAMIELPVIILGVLLAS